jgi:hypothetical protein
MAFILASDPLWLTLLISLAPPFMSGLLGVLIGIPIQMYLHHKQVERDDLAYKRTTADRKRTYLYDAYQVMRLLVRAYAQAVGTATLSKSDNAEETWKEAKISLEKARKEADAAIGAYMLVNQEIEIHIALNALNRAYTTWLRGYNWYIHLHTLGESHNDEFLEYYVKLVKLNDVIAEKSEELLTIAKAWEKELP